MLASEQFGQFKSRYPIVASIFEKHWQSSLEEYSKSLYHHKKISLEIELEEAFIEEWQRYGNDADDWAGLLKKLRNQPVLQTSHHVTPTNGPTFLAYDLISQAGLAEGETYLVAANSGVAFSNAAWSGALSFGTIALDELLESEQPLYQRFLKAARDRKMDGTSDNRISLIPSRQRDQLVFGTKISSQQLEIFKQFSNKLQQLLPQPEKNQTYSIWACRACARIQEQVFNTNKVVFFDINRVICNYLVKILNKSPSHPICELLFDENITIEFNRIFQNPYLFLGSYQSKKIKKIEPLAWGNSSTIGDKSGIQTYNKESLAEALQNEELCPGILLQFLVLRFINGIKCLGSFNQVEYLDNYRKYWLAMNLDWDLTLDEDEGIALTTGRVVWNGKSIWPLDLAWKNETIKIPELFRQPMSELWMPIVQQLAG